MDMDVNAQPVPILIVDDHRDNLLALESVLSPLGHRILQADSGRAALKMLLQEDVALMLLDVAMPDVDGYDVAELIRGRPANQDTPIIFLTANSRSASAAFRGYAVGAVDYIFKPVPADVLISKVNVFVDLYRRSRALKRQADDLRRGHDALELRVRERTGQLARANQRLRAVIAQRRRAEAERADLLRREQDARREAERVNRMKDEFLATLSHELRTPLNAMLGWAQLLETGQLEPDRLHRALGVIKNNALVQKQLIEDILDVSRIVNGKMALKMSGVDIRAIIDAALDTLRPAVEAKRITITTELPAALETCGDRDRLQQVVWNLLSNAIKFTPRDGRVAVRVEDRSPDLRIVVSDNGRGIAPAFLPHIFDRFSQADSTVTRTHGGLGIGMAICVTSSSSMAARSTRKAKARTRRHVHGDIADPRYESRSSSRCRRRAPTRNTKCPGPSCRAWRASPCSCRRQRARRAPDRRGHPAAKRGGGHGSRLGPGGPGACRPRPSRCGRQRHRDAR